MRAENNKVLVVDPNNHMQKTIVSNICKFFDSDQVFTCENGLDALWQSMDISPRYVIINYDTMNGSATELIKKLKIFLKDFLSIVLYSENCNEYTNDIKDIFFQLADKGEIIIVSYEDFIGNAHIFFH